MGFFLTSIFCMSTLASNLLLVLQNLDLYSAVLHWSSSSFFRALTTTYSWVCASSSTLTSQVTFTPYNITFHKFRNWNLAPSGPSWAFGPVGRGHWWPLLPWAYTIFSLVYFIYYYWRDFIMYLDIVNV